MFPWGSELGLAMAAARASAGSRFSTTLLAFPRACPSCPGHLSAASAAVAPLGVRAAGGRARRGGRNAHVAGWYAGNFCRERNVVVGEALHGGAARLEELRRDLSESLRRWQWRAGPGWMLREQWRGLVGSGVWSSGKAIHPLSSALSYPPRTGLFRPSSPSFDDTLSHPARVQGLVWTEKCCDQVMPLCHRSVFPTQHGDGANRDWVRRTRPWLFRLPR